MQLSQMPPKTRICKRNQHTLHPVIVVVILPGMLCAPSIFSCPSPFRYWLLLSPLVLPWPALLKGLALGDMRKAPGSSTPASHRQATLCTPLRGCQHRWKGVRG